MRVVGFVLASGLGLVACGRDSGPSDTGQITAESGGGQSATVGGTLLPYTVQVTDLQGAPKAGVTVTWAVVSGGGSVTPSATSDAAGLASATATLGLVSGVQTVQASARGFTGSPVSGPAGGTSGLRRRCADGEHITAPASPSAGPGC